MALADRMRIEAERRVALLSDEITNWVDQVNTNTNQLGIHQKQFQQLQPMMTGLLEKQTDLCKTLAAAPTPQAFAGDYYELLAEVVGTHELWRVFRYILSQLQDAQLGPLVDAADLIAADCYNFIQDRLQFMNIIPANERRAPPLVYLEADFSPATAARGQKINALGLPITSYRDLRLPIPIVTLPLDQANCIWLYSAIHHEVGHDVDADLKLSQELKKAIDNALTAANVDETRRDVWKQWTHEILADGFGILLGGAGFARNLSSLLLTLAPKMFLLDTAGPHPDPRVRVALLAEMLDLTGVAALQPIAAELRDTANALPGSGLTPYRDDCKIVAQVTLAGHYKALLNHTLLELNPALADDVAQADKLKTYLKSNVAFNKPSQPVPYRLVPIAAQLRLNEIDSPDLAALDTLQTRALTYFKSLSRPQFLAAPADNQSFMQRLVREIRFTEAIDE